MPSSMGSSQPRDRTHVSSASCIGRQVLSTGATWEDQVMSESISNSAAGPLRALSGPFYFTISSLTPRPPARPGPLWQPLIVGGTHGLCF